MKEIFKSGKIVYIEYLEDNENLFKYFAEIQEYEKETKRYILDDIKVVSSDTNDYDLAHNYKMEDRYILEVFDTLKEAQEVSPHLFI